MHFLKKISAAALAAAMCVSLGSCGSSKPYDFDLGDYLQPASMENIKVSRKEIEKQFQDAKDKLLEKATEKVDLKTGDELKKGDTVNIDYEGKAEGKGFSGGSGTNYQLEIGSNSTRFPEGFEDGLVGKKVGDEFTLELKYPEDSSKASDKASDAASDKASDDAKEKAADKTSDDKTSDKKNELVDPHGKDVVYTVTVNSAKRTVVPDYTDAYVAEQTKNDAHPYTTIKDYEEGTRKSIQDSLAMEAYIKACRVTEYPKKEYNDTFKSYYQIYEYKAGASGVTVKTYMESQGASLDDLYDSINSYASTMIKREMVYYYIARTCELDPLSDEEYKEGAEHLVKEKGVENVDELTDNYGKDAIYQSVLFEKVSEYIGSKSVIDEDMTSKDSTSGSATSEKTSDSAKA